MSQQYGNDSIQIAPPLPVGQQPSSSLVDSLIVGCCGKAFKEEFEGIRDDPNRPSMVSIIHSDSGVSCDVRDVRFHCEVRMGGVFVKLESVMTVPKYSQSGQWDILVPITEESAVSRCFGHINPPDLNNSNRNEFIIESVVTEESQVSTNTPVHSTSNRYTFRAPITLNAGDHVRLFVTYFQPPLFDYTTNNYTFCLPLSTTVKGNGPQYCGQLLDQIASVSCVLSSETELLKPLISGIPHSTVEEFGGDLWITSAPGPWKNHDFIVSYKYKSTDLSVGISTHAAVEDENEILQVPSKMQSSVQMGSGFQFSQIPLRVGSATLAINLNASQVESSSYNRAIVFIIDKSYTMNGQPLEAAKCAVINALPTLTSGDMFCIIEFDHRHSITVPMTPVAQYESVSSAIEIVRRIQVGGGTSITDPMKTAMTLLKQIESQYLPFIVLLTDGHVHDEPVICQYVTNENSSWGTPYPPRILTFGIGDYCNSTFIRMLSVIGRGHCMTASTNNIALLTAKMTRLISLAASPVLSNIAVFKSHSEEQLATYPIPDLTLGSPVMIYSLVDLIEIPKTVRVVGYLASGQLWQLDVAVTRTNAPLGKLAAKRELELLSCSAWYQSNIGQLEASQRYYDQALQLSYASNVACPGVTRFVVVNVRANQYSAFQESQRKAKTAEDRREANAALVGVGVCVVVGLAIGAHMGVFDDDIVADVSNLVQTDCFDDCDCDCDCDIGGLC